MYKLRPTQELYLTGGAKKLEGVIRKRRINHSGQIFRMTDNTLAINFTTSFTKRIKITG